MLAQLENEGKTNVVLATSSNVVRMYGCAVVVGSVTTQGSTCSMAGMANTFSFKFSFATAMESSSFLLFLFLSRI